eukprot:2357413-Prymnesium_polylepis.1
MGDDNYLDFAAAAASTTTSAPVPHTTFVSNSSSKQQQPIKRDGLDYGKWDKFAVDDSEDEADDGDDGELAARPADAAEAEDELTPEELETLRKRIRTDNAFGAASQPAVPAAPVVPSVDERDARHQALVARLTRNGAQRDGYLWRQTEAEAELSIVLPAGTRAKMLAIELLPSDHAHAHQQVSVRWRAPGPGGATGVCFERALAYPVEEPEGEEGKQADQLMWELCDFETAAAERLLKVTMKKRE